MQVESELPAALNQLSNVSSTALLTLWARAQESQSTQPILHDPAAVKMVERLRPYLVESVLPSHQWLMTYRLPQQLIVYLAMRTRHFDQAARNFVHRFEQQRTVIVNLACGLDTRFERLDDGQIRLVELDLSPMVDLKRQLVTNHPRHVLLGGSVLDTTWMDELERYDSTRFLFLAEGLLMYLDEQDVKRLVQTLAARFPGSELVAEVFQSFWLRWPWRGIVVRKMQRQLGFGSDVMFRFGLAESRALEAWSPQLEFMRAWSHLDEAERKLGFLQFMRHLRFARRQQWVVHYQLG